ncbi:MAG TPA: hypothetical protein DCY07_07255 [Rhodospirillaceae bacterium]|nr:hypothetical protein [Rhodospirillaceae bacterium]
MKSPFFAGMLSCLSLVLISGSALAASTGIQMLPPMQSDDASKPCTFDADPAKNEGSKILTWDGHDSIKCHNNVSISPAGIAIMNKTNSAGVTFAGKPEWSSGIQTVLTFHMGRNLDTGDLWNLSVRGQADPALANGMLLWRYDADAAQKWVQAITIDQNGNVAIGNTLPNAKLHVSGGRTFLQANAEPYALGVGFSQTSGLVYFGAASNVLSPDAVISNNAGAPIARFTNSGNVGIGIDVPASKLDVNGGVKVADDNVNCTASKAGTVRFRSGRFQGCNGTTWVALGVTRFADIPTITISNGCVDGAVPAPDPWGNGYTDILYSEMLLRWVNTCGARFCIAKGMGFQSGKVTEFIHNGRAVVDCW